MAYCSKWTFLGFPGSPVMMAMEQQVLCQELWKGWMEGLGERWRDGERAGREKRTAGFKAAAEMEKCGRLRDTSR